jgi:sulfate adenylyltransferase subunit 1
MNILKFITAGSVDDGKSTLIGRLLYDSQAVFQDQLEAISRASKQRANGELDLSLLTDGLRAEREQGITIDVAYKYFQTEKRKFIIIDAPGHLQYTRNMVTGASHADAAVILVDARKGVIEQTKRHTFLCALLGIHHIFVAINKMDLVDFEQNVFEKIKTDYLAFSQPLKISNLHFIPVSALKGDNIVNTSENMNWYNGSTLLDLLENATVLPEYEQQKARFQVQYVIRPQNDDYHDYRGYAGTILSGSYKVGDAIKVFPTGTKGMIKKIEVHQQAVQEAHAGMPVVLHLAQEIDSSRGDVWIKQDENKTDVQSFESALCWMDETKPLAAGNKYLLQQGSKQVKCAVRQINSKYDINNLEKETQVANLQLNDIGEVSIKVAQPLLVDSYQENTATGCFILIDEFTNSTVAAGMITSLN